MLCCVVVFMLELRESHADSLFPVMAAYSARNVLLVLVQSHHMEEKIINRARCRSSDSNSIEFLEETNF
jgi:hypothetical protein